MPMTTAWACWDAVERLVLAQPAGRDLHLIKAALPHPTEGGLDRAMGIPKGGSFRHFRRTVMERSCLHVREYRDHYQVHWDRTDPRLAPLAHWWGDVRGGKVTAVLGALALLGVPALFLL